MFEQYSVPSLTYCIDSVMSFYHNNKPASGSTFGADGLVVSFNTASTSVIPILNGKGVLSHAKRSVFLDLRESCMAYLLLTSSSHSHRHPNPSPSHPSTRHPNWCNDQASPRLLRSFTNDRLKRYPYPRVDLPIPAGLHLTGSPSITGPHLPNRSMS
jgi:hypothetical protein